MTRKMQNKNLFNFSGNDYKVMIWFLSFTVIEFLYAPSQVILPKGMTVLLLFPFLCLASLFPGPLPSFH